jgi:hypothetical protein
MPSLSSLERPRRPARPSSAGTAPLVGREGSGAERDRGRIGRQPSPIGIAGQLLHGVAFSSLAILALVHFGSVFWFLSSVVGSVALLSLYSGGVALKTHWRLSRRTS